MNTFLKMKLATLAQEGRIIRAEEVRLCRRLARNRARVKSWLEAPAEGWTKPEAYTASRSTQTGIDYCESIRVQLHKHRTHDVRKEARATCLAYGFLRGRQYDQMEAFAYSPPKWEVVERLAVRYAEDDPREVRQKLARWLEEAKSHLTRGRLTVQAQVLDMGYEPVPVQAMVTNDKVGPKIGFKHHFGSYDWLKSRLEYFRL